MNSRINLFDRIFLYYNAWSDGNRNAIHEVPAQNDEYTIILSPFISLELTNLSLNMQNLFYRRLHLVRLPGKGASWNRRFMHLSDALALIESQISELESQLEDYESSLKHGYADGKVYEDLLRSRTSAAEHGAEHLEKMYADQLSDIKRQIREKINRFHTTSVALLDEKVRLLENAFILCDLLSAKHLNRIQYYYSVACRVRRRLPIASLSMSDYVELMDNTVFMRYQAELKNTVDRRKRLQEKLTKKLFDTP